MRFVIKPSRYSGCLKSRRVLFPVPHDAVIQKTSWCFWTFVTFTTT